MQDAEGRWWAKHRETGVWHYYDGNTWVRDTPPDYQEATTEPASTEQPTQTRLLPRPRDAKSEEKRRVWAWVLGVGLVGVVGLIAIAVYLLGGNIGGSETAELPNVLGQTRNEAEEILKSRGFEVKVETEKSSEDAGRVIRQSPSSGEAEKGSTVAITVGEDALPKEKESPSEKAYESTPGYNLIQDPTGGLSLEAPASWTNLSGADSEYPGMLIKNWSNWAGEDITSSITTTPDLADWHDLDPPVSGAYIVASRTLAQKYTNDELIYSTLYAGQADNCVKGPAKDFRHSSLSGKMQTWYNCRGQGITNFIVAAAPAGRECVIVLQARLATEADREAIQHIIDTLKVDCGLVAS